MLRCAATQVHKLTQNPNHIRCNQLITRKRFSRTIHNFNATGAPLESMTRLQLNLLLRFATPHRNALLLGGGILFLESGFMLALPYLGGVLTEQLLRDRSNAVENTLFALFAVITVQAVLRFATVFTLGRCSNRLLANMRLALYRHLQCLPMAYFHAKQKGDILSILLSDIYNIGVYLTSTLVGVLGLLLTLVGSIIFMWQIDSTLAIIGACTIPAFYLVIKLFGRKIRFVSTSISEASWRLFAVAEENLGLTSIIKAFSREQYEINRYQSVNETMRSLEDKQLLYAGGLNPIVQWVAGAAVIALLWVASEKVAAQTMSASALVTFLLYASLLTRPVSAFADLYGKTQSVRSSIVRVQDVFDQKTEPFILQTSNEERKPGSQRSAPTIEFRNVAFAYPDREPSLSQFNLAITAGETVSLSGKNGAGKTTLVHLLLRYMDPAQGDILIDGVDIKQIELTRLRRMIGFVPQHIQILNGTIHDNIAYGNPTASPSEVEAASQLAQAHEFVVELPEGYQTIVGDQGVRLSGGQRQRVALARALMVDPPILVFDEAMSMFDREGEARFFAMFQELRKTRTIIMIAHSDEAESATDRIVRVGTVR
jgi:ATP-binding cassette, subfamily B, bacterial